MWKTIDKIIDFLADISNPFESDEEYENRMIQEELNKHINRLKRYNKHNLIENQIKPFLYQQFVLQNECFPTEDQLERMAQNAFKQSQDLGYIDCLNNRIGDYQ